MSNGNVRRVSAATLILVLGAFTYATADPPKVYRHDSSEPTASPVEIDHTIRLRWFVFLDLVNANPKLKSEEPIEDYFNPAMRLLAPTFDDVATVGTLRDKHLLWVPQIGIGRLLGDRWRLYVQGGYTAGKVRTKADDTSIFLLPLHTDFEIQRGAASTTLGLDFFPWRHPELGEFDGLWERLRAARPKIGSSATFTYATYDAKIKAGFKPFQHFLDLHLSDSWYLPSINVNVGAEMPVSPNNSISFNAGYNFFFDQEDDFEGPAFTLTWSHYFR